MARRSSGRKKLKNSKSLLRCYGDYSKKFSRRFALDQSEQLGVAARDTQKLLEVVDRLIKGHRLKVCQWLDTVLDSGADVLDLFSGDAKSVVPLVMSGRIQGLQLLDSPVSGYLGSVQSTLNSLQLSERVRHCLLALDSSVEASELPSTLVVTMIGSGLVFPDDCRGDFSSGHEPIEAVHIDLKSPCSLRDVLRVLSGEERVVWFADNADPKFSDANQRAVPYVEGVADEFGGEWSVHWDTSDAVKGSVLGKLVHC